MSIYNIIWLSFENSAKMVKFVEMANCEQWMNDDNAQYAILREEETGIKLGQSTETIKASRNSCEFAVAPCELAPNAGDFGAYRHLRSVRARPAPKVASPTAPYARDGHSASGSCRSGEERRSLLWEKYTKLWAFVVWQLHSRVEVIFVCLCFWMIIIIHSPPSSGICWISLNNWAIANSSMFAFR